MEVEQERDAGQPDGQRGEGEEVRQGRDLDEPIPAVTVLHREPDRRQRGKGEVLAEMPGEAGELATDREADEAHPVPRLGLRAARDRADR